MKNGKYIINQYGLFLTNVDKDYYDAILQDSYYTKINNLYGIVQGPKQGNTNNDNFVGIYVHDYKKFIGEDKPMVSYEGYGRGAY